MNDKQQHLQVILWRDNDNGKIHEYKMTTVTFRLSNSPYLAIRWLKAVADAVAEKYPLASNAIKSNFYGDDHTGGASRVSEAIELYKQLKNAFGSCNLRKIVSNSLESMNHISEHDKENIDTNTVKVLGIIWNPMRDTLEFQINFNTKVTTKTKRHC